jgi:uncharacterized integral membrane protein
MTEPAAPHGTTSTLPPPSANGSAPPPPAPQPPGRGQLQTLISGMRTGLITGFAALVVAVIFIIQNAHAANISFLGVHLVLPLAAALLLAVIAGALAMAAAGPRGSPSCGRSSGTPWERSRMAEHDLRQRVEVSDHDRTVATAEVSTSEGSGGTARVSLRAEPGHITPGRRASLVDAVLDLPEVQESARVEAAFRLGDCESLHRLQERCEDVNTRSAGWSALVDANLPSSRRGGED